ncbi:hypothetical protein QYF61_001121 [Mycteria americana]|uniref:Uncharacterized protein n=1 Tax=Mycteria americana TaxID=33587 RepID=A0AAN7N9N6_MYCAM|nr:hypothetical protein QYF61_001121 [Mycteria americana]
MLGIACSCASKRWFLKADQHSWTPKPSKADSQGTLLSSSPIQGSNSAVLFSHYTENFQLNHFMITVAKTPAYPHIPHKSFSIHKQQVQEGIFPSWLTEYSDGDSTTSLGSLFQCLPTLSVKKFPNIQSKPPLAQLEAISSCPIACYLGEETNTHLSTTSFQAKQSQLPQLLLIRLVLQTLHQLCCPSLDALQHLSVFLVVRGPKLNTVFEVRPHQCQVQGHDHCPSPAGHAIFDTSQDAIGLLGHLGILPAHIQLAIDQHPQVLFCQAAFQPLFPKPVVLRGVVVAQVQDLALSLVHTIGLGPSIQPVQVPL